MKYKDIKPTLEKLREEWKTATPQRKKEIENEADRLKPYLVDHYGCYVCDEPVSIFSNLFPFCKEEHKNEYNGNQATQAPIRKLSIEEMQKKLLGFARDERKKK